MGLSSKKKKRDHGLVDTPDETQDSTSEEGSSMESPENVDDIPPDGDDDQFPE